MVDRLEALLSKIKSTVALLKIDDLRHKMEALSLEMNSATFWDTPEMAQKVAQDFEDIRSEVEKWALLEQSVQDTLELAKTGDTTLASEVEEQTVALEKQFSDYEFVLLLDGPYDKNGAIVSVHAGSGGTEAQDWSAMLVRMVWRFAEKMGWAVVVLDESRGAEAGYKSITFEIKGRYAYGYLKSEHGVHRLVRISPFDAEKMRHTSFAQIEVLPLLDVKDTTITIDPKDLRIDTFMSGGKGGQSVNTTYSAVRIVHLPTGTTVQCQNERSQMQNKEMAMSILRSRLQRLDDEKRAKERTDMRGEYKSAEWGNQIRSYVLHPYHMVNDHRMEYKTADPEAVLEGELLPLSEAYLRWLKQ